MTVVFLPTPQQAGLTVNYGSGPRPGANAPVPIYTTFWGGSTGPPRPAGPGRPRSRTPLTPCSRTASRFSVRQPSCLDASNLYSVLWRSCDTARGLPTLTEASMFRFPHRFRSSSATRHGSIRRRRSLQPEMPQLESRALLSTVSGRLPGLVSHPAAAVAALARPALFYRAFDAFTTSTKLLSGSLTGQADVMPITKAKGTVSFTSSGSVIGRSTFDGSVSYSVDRSGTVKYTHGTATLADTNGDAIHVSFAGAGQKTGAYFSLTANGSVKGGTKKYARAKGTFFFSKGSFNDLTGAFSAKLTIVLTDHGGSPHRTHGGGRPPTVVA